MTSFGEKYSSQIMKGEKITFELQNHKKNSSSSCSWRNQGGKKEKL